MATPEAGGRSWPGTPARNPEIAASRHRPELDALKPNPDFTRAVGISPGVEAAVRDAFEYHPWNQTQIEHGKSVRDALITAVLEIIRYVPPCPDRTTAIRKIREARMDCNSAITHGGKY